MDGRYDVSVRGTQYSERLFCVGTINVHRYIMDACIQLDVYTSNVCNPRSGTLPASVFSWATFFIGHLNRGSVENGAGNGAHSDFSLLASKNVPFTKNRNSATFACPK